MAPSDHQPLRHNIRPTLRAPRQNDDDWDQGMQQAGRSPTNLNAHASAQTLREGSRSSSWHTASLPPSRPASRLSTRELVASHQTPPSTTNDGGPDSQYASTRPSSSGAALVPFRSDHTGRKNSDHSLSQSSASTSDGQHSRTFAAVQTGSLPRISTLPSVLKPSLTNSPAAASRLSTPRSVRDLGSDYSRYFNPFATKNNSEQDLSIAASQRMSSSDRLQPNRAVSATELSKRLSNPFKDERLASNPSHSSDRSVALTASAPDKAKDEKAPIVAVAAIPSQGETPLSAVHADPEKAFFSRWLDDRLGAPLGVPLYTDQIEDDDDMHMPQWDDDKRFKPSWRDRFSKENIVNTFGMIFLLAGLLTIFIVLPVVSYTGTNLIPYEYETPLDQMPGYGYDPWAHVNDRSYPLLQNIRSQLVDPDTPDSAKSRKASDGSDMVLVFSDEFNAKNRTFYEGDDPYWFAPDIWYGATGDLEWYDPDAVNTGDGTLQLQLDAFLNHGLAYRSGMLNSWNQACFKGGVLEVSMSLPGPAGVHGLWPGVWTMGNLGRPGYLATTDGVWPYTYSSCDAGITPNQSHTDGLSFLPGQRLAQCTCNGEDHPTPGTGRGAPEIDIAEVSGDYSGLKIGVATQSFQVAPFDIWYYPNYDFMENPNYNISLVNTWVGGPYQEAVSTTTMLNNDWYDGIQYQKYSFEYVPGTSANSHITWFVGDEETMKFDARAIGPNGIVDQRVVSEEPMSIILNLGMSHSWVDIDLANLRFPTVMRIDYVRWYQKEGEEMVTCDPPGYETTDYIASHPEAYNNPNYTHWDETGYSWPKNSLMHDCST